MLPYVGMNGTQSHVSLFNDERYQRCNLAPGQHLFRYDHIAGERLVGTFSGVVDGGLLECGHSAPFGGIDWVRPDEPVGSISNLLRGAMAKANAEGPRAIRVRARPGYFGANDVAAQFALLNLGARVESCELSLGLETWRFASIEDYAASLDRSARKQLRQALETGFDFAPAETASEWSRCFDLLVETRRRRGARLRISFAYVMRLRDIFGSRIAMHRLLRNGELAGAALLYRVTPSWEYVVAWGDDLTHRGKRVMNLMAYHLVGEAIAQRVAVIDLGISSVDGVPDDGLIHFKRGIGAATGLRLNFCLPTSDTSARQSQ